MDSRFRASTILLACLGLANCAAHKTTPYVPHQFHSNRKACHKVQSAFADPKPLKIKETVVMKTYGNYQVDYLQFPSSGNNGQKNNMVEAMYYKSKLPGQHKLLLVMPIWGGSTYPPKGITATLLRLNKGNINIIRVLGVEPVLSIEKLQDSPTVAEFHHLLKLLRVRTKNTLIDVKALTNWAAKQKNILRNEISIIGFSKSSVVAGIIAQTDPNVTGAIFVMGGSNPADMIHTCNLYDVRKKITKRFKWTNERLLAELHHYLGPMFNVAHYPTHLDPCHVLVFDSYYDRCIMKKTQDELWHAMGNPERISFYFGHQTSFGAMTFAGGYYMRKKINRFLNQNNCVLKNHTKTSH